MAELLRTLLAIPIAAAIVAALLGPRRAVAIRWISLGAKSVMTGSSNPCPL